ncbi:uncharacterized protein LOC134259753 [Saccostrea cucullata]|uniref:uncharacterized protein LOC134259753 n=1 Tax=Saccostrea cuccullata TaxID=36930 RepID=UPI002ED1F88A
MGRLTLEERILCNLLHQQGNTISEIARRLGTTRKTIRKTIERRQTTGSYEDAARPGRPRISTAREDRILVRESLQNRRETVPQLRTEWMQNGVQASNTTVRRRLKEAGLVAHVALKKLSPHSCYRRKRLQFALAHANWTWVDWSAVLWYRFTLFQNDSRVFVRRRMRHTETNCTNSQVWLGWCNWGAMYYRGTLDS